MTAMRVCPRHEMAFAVGGECPYCEPAVSMATAARPGSYDLSGAYSLALCSTPTGSVTEVWYPGYARCTVDMEQRGDRLINANSVRFPSCTGMETIITCCKLHGVNRSFDIPLTVPFRLFAGITPALQVGAITITID